jgi:hypothetical protein
MEYVSKLRIWRIALRCGKINLEFFAASKTADKLKNQFEIKIQKAEEEIDKLKKKLSILKEF